MSDTQLIEAFLDALFLEQGLSENTISAYRSDLEKFLLFITKEKVSTSLLAVSSQDIEAYLAYRVDKGLKAKSSARAISALKRFYLYWVREKKNQSIATRYYCAA